MKYRIKFSKNGPIKYIGHLDVMRYFQKALRRAQLPVKYSEGFSPHQLISFAFPLSVGYTSDGEYFDVEMTQDIEEEELVNRLNAAMAPGFRILDSRRLDDKAANCMAAVYAASYEISFKDRVILPENFKEKCIDYFSQMTIPVNKPKKKGEGFVEIDLKEFLYSYSVDENTVSFTVNASSANNIRPSFVIKCLFDFLSIDIDERDYFVKRIDILGNAADEGIKLVSLMDI